MVLIINPIRLTLSSIFGRLLKMKINHYLHFNDGVRLNVRPFVEAGVLRSKFNVKWGIDRGKNPAGSNWGEIRDNDKYLRLDEKTEGERN